MNYIIGKIVCKFSNYIILENNFIGYKINVSNIDNFELDKYRKLYIYKKTQIINNNISEEYYGFENYKDKMMFEKLISINGIGPKTSLNIISNDLLTLKYYIKTNDIEKLCSLNGITKKVAISLINNIEVEDNILDEFSNSNNEQNSTNSKNCKNDVISALKSLGYKKDVIDKSISEIPNEDFIIDSEEQLSDLISKVIKDISSKSLYEN